MVETYNTDIWAFWGHPLPISFTLLCFHLFNQKKCILFKEICYKKIYNCSISKHVFLFWDMTILPHNINEWNSMHLLLCREKNESSQFQ